MSKLLKYKNQISNKFDEIVENESYSEFFNTDRVKEDDIEYHELVMGRGKTKDIYINKNFSQANNESFEATLSDDQKFYRDNGFIIKDGLIPTGLIDDYMALRERHGFSNEQFNVNEYIKHTEARNILTHRPLTELLRELHSAEMGLIFMLTKFISTQRSWHQDSYLDHDDAIPRVAVWIALDDITEDSGPFEFIPGSHKWHSMSNQKINEFMNDKYKWPQGQRNIPDGQVPWGRASELFVGPAVEKKIKREGVEKKKFIAKKGDVLVWYGRLMHRGSVPTNPNAQRPSIIGHYAPIFERDRGVFLRDSNGSFYLTPGQ